MPCVIDLPRVSHVRALPLIIAISEFDYALNSRSRKTGRAVCIETDFTTTTCQSPFCDAGRKWDFLASFLYSVCILYRPAKSKDPPRRLRSIAYYRNR